MNSNLLSSSQADDKAHKFPSLRFALFCNAFITIGFLLPIIIFELLSFCWMSLFSYFSKNSNDLIDSFFGSILDYTFFVTKTIDIIVLLFLFFGIGYLLTKLLPNDWRGVDWKKNALRSYAIGSILVIIASIILGFPWGFRSRLDNIIYFSPTPILLLFITTKTGERLWQNILAKFRRTSLVNSGQASSAQTDNNTQKIPTVRIILFCNTFILIGFILFSAIVFSSFIGYMFLHAFLSNKPITAIYYDSDRFLSYIIKISPTILITSLSSLFLFFGIGYLLTKLLPKNWRGVDLKKNASTSYATGSILAIIALSFLVSNIGSILPADLILYIIFFSLTPALLLFNNTNAGELAWQNIWSKFRRKKMPSNAASRLS
jgi:hypothetical protein